LPVGATVPMKFKVDRHWPEAKVPIAVQPVDVPPNLAVGNNNQPMTVAADKNEADVQIQVRNNVPPGVYNLVLRGTAQVPFNKDPKATQKPPLASQAVTTPVKLKVYNSVADVTLGTPMLTLKGGQDAEIIVRINRLNDYKGEYKVALVPPQGFQGVTAAEVTIPANANEGKLMLKCAANAAPATNPNVVVRVSATVEKVVLNSEAKVGVTVVK
jgi:hypothetical protein